MTFTGPLAYAAVFLAAVIEGEVVFVTASVLVAAGKLDPLAVMTCGALERPRAIRCFSMRCAAALPDG